MKHFKEETWSREIKSYLNIRKLLRSVFKFRTRHLNHCSNDLPRYSFIIYLILCRIQLIEGHFQASLTLGYHTARHTYLIKFVTKALL